jgi:SAM-dependent methyltransferase
MNQIGPAEFWNERFGGDTYRYGIEPNAWLASQAIHLRPGMTALVPGDGEGRNGVWLARQGLDVTTVDVSSAGVAKARALADRFGVKINTELADLTAWNWPEKRYDLVASLYLHLASAERPTLHRRMVESLKPGGLLVIEAFTPGQLGRKSGGPQSLDLLFTAELLRTDFGSLAVLALEECETELREGTGHSGVGAVVRGLFRRR